MDVEKWEAIFRLVAMAQPLLEWLIGLVERLFGGVLGGQQKKEKVMSAVTAILPISDDLDVNVALSESINQVVKLKNEAGEFKHYAMNQNDPRMIPT